MIESAESRKKVVGVWKLFGGEGNSAIEKQEIKPNRGSPHPEFHAIFRRVRRSLSSAESLTKEPEEPQGA